MHRALIAPLLLLVTSVPAGAGEETQAVRTEQPNIVLLIADDLGWVDVSTGRTNLGKGSQFHQTPNIDRLAGEGMSFTAAYVQQNCPPTR
ncbi:MAG: sulfatase-like hydrolase/transferase, partial [Planctomycetes bacterium]|nr:sulfatase-like hydrolase/transferase [Planctomycetota bacterium]